MQSYQKCYFVPEPGHLCYHCPPSLHWICRLLTSANPGEEGESTPFVPIPGTPFSALRHIHISQSPFYPRGLCWSAASREKPFVICAQYAKFPTLLSKLARSADLKEAITLSAVYNTPSPKKLQGNPSPAGINNLSANPANAQTFESSKILTTEPTQLYNQMQKNKCAANLSQIKFCGRISISHFIQSTFVTGFWMDLLW